MSLEEDGYCSKKKYPTVSFCPRGIIRETSSSSDEAATQPDPFAEGPTTEHGGTLEKNHLEEDVEVRNFILFFFCAEMSTSFEKGVR